MTLLRYNWSNRVAVEEYPEQRAAREREAQLDAMDERELRLEVEAERIEWPEFERRIDRLLREHPERTLAAFEQEKASSDDYLPGTWNRDKALAEARKIDSVMSRQIIAVTVSVVSVFAGILVLLVAFMSTRTQPSIVVLGLALVGLGPVAECYIKRPRVKQETETPLLSELPAVVSTFDALVDRLEKTEKRPTQPPPKPSDSRRAAVPCRPDPCETVYH